MSDKNDEDPPSGYRPLKGGLSRSNILVPAELGQKLSSARAHLHRALCIPSDYYEAGLPAPAKAFDNEERVAAIKRVMTIEPPPAAAEPDADPMPDQDPMGKGFKPSKVVSAEEARQEPMAKAEAKPVTPHAQMSDAEFFKQSEQTRDAHLEELVKRDPYPAAAAAAGNRYSPHERGMLVPTINTDAAHARYAELRMKRSGSFLTSVQRNNLRDLELLLRRGHRRLVKLRPDLEQRLQELEERMPNFAAVIEHVLAAVNLARRTGTPLRIKPILLMGGPGVGKSYFAQELAKAFDVGSYRYDLSAAESTAVMLGSEAHWTDAQSGVLQAMLANGSYGNACAQSGLVLANPLVVLDELDKAKDGGGGYRPLMSLLTLLEPATSARLVDKASGIEFDGSHVIYVGTANSFDNLSPPLLSRFELAQVRALTVAEAVIVARGMHDRMRRDLKLEGFGKPASGVIPWVAEVGNPRLMRVMLETAFARAVMRGGTDGNQVEMVDLGWKSRESMLH